VLSERKRGRMSRTRLRRTLPSEEKAVRSDHWTGVYVLGLPSSTPST
jgi:hypothetical protein